MIPQRLNERASKRNDALSAYTAPEEHPRENSRSLMLGNDVVPPCPVRCQSKTAARDGLVSSPSPYILTAKHQRSLENSVVTKPQLP